MRHHLILFALLFAAGCADDDPAPVVHVVSATPDTLDPANDLADDLRIVVDYSDRDGDLGNGVAQVHDCRADTLVTELPIPAIAADAMLGSPISGTLDLYVDDVGAAVATTMPSTCSELGVAALAANQTVFCVVLVDSQQHAGPGDCTEPVALAP
jgi:hypothetical protein